MFEHLKTLIRRLGRLAFCHHGLYGLMTVIYLAGGLQLVDKSAVAAAASAVYLALAIRG